MNKAPAPVPVKATAAEVAERSAKIKGCYYSMQGHAEKRVEKYLELAGMKLSDLK